MLLTPIYFLIATVSRYLSPFSEEPPTQPACYYLDGSPSLATDRPCSLEPGSTCCPSGWECWSDGSCRDPSAGPAALLHVYTCTDPDWASVQCGGGMCPNDPSTGDTRAFLQCSDGQYCCDAKLARKDNSSTPFCCDITDSPRMPEHIMVSLLSEMQEMARCGHRHCDSKLKPAVDLMPLKKRQYDDGYDSEPSPFPYLIVGPVVGVLFFLFCLGAICLYCVCCRNRRSRTVYHPAGPILPPPMPANNMPFGPPPPIWHPPGRYEPVELNDLDDKPNNPQDFGPKRPYVGDPRKRDIPGTSDV